LDLLSQHKTEYINWIYQLQITSDDDEAVDRCGFRGSLSATQALGSANKVGSISSHPLDTGHITMTYAALNCLLILGDDLTRLNRRGILAGVKALQLPNGRYLIINN